MWNGLKNRRKQKEGRRDFLDRTSQERENLVDNEGIAIIGMAGRFPGARNIEEYWRNLKEGRDSITFFTREDAKDAGVRKEDYTHKDYVCAGGLLEDVEYFDEGFFGMTPREAADMDPQQRLFLECVYEALEDAGYAKDQINVPVGVFAGANMSTYFLYHLADKIGVRDDFSLTVGNDKDYIATRTSYIFNLKGPSISVQTACSTSMTAVALACDSLDSFQCDMAVAGGVAVKLPQKMGYLYQEGMIASPDGYTRPFDESGSGTVFTSVSGVVILKRLADALRDGDQIYAVVKGIAVNNDGSDKVGFTAPSREGQRKVIETAQYLAEVNPEDIGYMEAHGTGTKLGDPIELSALAKVFGKSTKKRGYCALGSVKGNIGHAVSGAGIAGLIKTALIVKYGEIPPSIHFESPNKEIDFINSPFYVNTRLRKWDSNGLPRIAGVSSFGFGGTNVHAVLQEADIGQIVRGNRESDQTKQILTLSAKSETALDKMRVHLARFLRDYEDISFEDVIFTLHVGRKNFDHRLAFVCIDRKEAMEILFDIDNQEVQRGKTNKRDVLPAFEEGALAAAKSGSEEAELLVTKYWVNGGTIDWDSYHSGSHNQRVSLPTYAFDRKCHWVEPYHLKKAELGGGKPVVPRSIDDWLYKMDWKRSDCVKPADKGMVQGSKWLLFMDEIGIGDEAYEYLGAAGAKITRVYPGVNFAENENGKYIINELSKEDYERLIHIFAEDSASPHYILHFWNVTRDKLHLCAPGDMENAAYKSFYSLLFLAQALSKAEFGRKLKLSVITNHMHLIAGEGVIEPEKSLVLGPVKVISKENINILCQSIDLEISENMPGNKGHLAVHICAEIMSEKMESAVAYRGPFRWMPISEEFHISSEVQKSYHKSGAVYVITGGLGGIGFELAKHLAGKNQVNLVLTGRSPLNKHAEKIEQLKNLGANVSYFCADCTQEDQMEKVFVRTMEQYGQIHGIFHIAGTIETEELVNKTVAAAGQILAPKVKGILILDKWITKYQPQFVVLFSSIGGILGTAGQVDYNSANSFLDAYAWYRLLKGGTRVIAVNWDSWDGLGMLAARSGEINRKVKGNIKVSEGLYLLDKIIDAGISPQVVVSKMHFPSLLADIRSFFGGETADKQHSKVKRQEEDNRPELENKYEAPINRIQSEIVGIWEELLGVHPVGIQDDYFDLGGHSMMATEMVPKLNNLFQKKITLRELFEHSTVEQLALFLEMED